MLTPKQEKFAQNIIAGMQQGDAYRDAYDAENMADSTVAEAASRLANNSKITARINELRDKAASEACLTREMKRKKLRELAESEYPSVVLKAIDLDNKMEGEYTQHVDFNGDLDISIAMDYGEDDAD